MLVANSFDLWQKDTFFSAAEDVQQSADIMESAYRAWLRARKDGLMSQNLDTLNRELRMALGTAKWQLEEFERAVCLSYRNNGDDVTNTRHREFVSAIEDQIYRVETALKESLEVEGKKPFRWVNLDKDECDDLAHFLSGTPGTSQMMKDDCIKVGAAITGSLCKSIINEDCSYGSQLSSKMQISNQGKSSEEAPTSSEDICGFIELQGRKISETGHEISYRADQISSNQTVWSSPDRNTLEIVVDTDDRQTNGLTEETPKDKGSKPFIWRSRGEHYHRAKEVQRHTQIKLMNWINHHLRGTRSQRQHVLPVLPVKSIRFVIALMLTIFLFVPFLLHST